MFTLHRSIILTFVFLLICGIFFQAGLGAMGFVFMVATILMAVISLIKFLDVE